MRFILALALAASLSACVTPVVGAPTLTTVERAQAQFDRIKPFSEAFLPMLPAASQSRVRLALIAAQIALDEAKHAETAIDQLRALREAEAAIVAVAAAAPAS